MGIHSSGSIHLQFASAVFVLLSVATCAAQQSPYPYSLSNQSNQSIRQVEPPTLSISIEPSFYGNPNLSMRGLPFFVFSHVGDHCTARVAEIEKNLQVEGVFHTGDNGCANLILEQNRLYFVVFDTVRSSRPASLNRFAQRAMIPAASSIVVSNDSAARVAVPLYERRSELSEDFGSVYLLAGDEAASELQNIAAIVQLALKRLNRHPDRHLEELSEKLKRLLPRVAGSERAQPPDAEVLVDDECSPPSQAVICEFPIQWCTRAGPFKVNPTVSQHIIWRKIKNRHESPCIIAANRKVTLRAGEWYEIFSIVDDKRDVGLARQPVLVEIPKGLRKGEVYRHYVPGLFGRELSERDIAVIVKQMAEVNDRVAQADLKGPNRLAKLSADVTRLTGKKPSDFEHPSVLVRPPVDVLVFQTAFRTAGAPGWVGIQAAVRDGQFPNTTIWAIVDDSSNPAADWAESFSDAIALQDRDVSGRVQRFGLLGFTGVSEVSDEAKVMESVAGWLDGGAAGLWLYIDGRPNELLREIVATARMRRRVVFACYDALDVDEYDSYLQFDFVTSRSVEREPRFDVVKTLSELEQSGERDRRERPEVGFGVQRFGLARAELGETWEMVKDSRSRFVNLTDRKQFQDIAYKLPTYWQEYLTLVEAHNKQYRSSYVTSQSPEFGDTFASAPK